MKALTKLLLVFSMGILGMALTAHAFAQEKMSMDEYNRQLADWQNRSVSAQSEFAKVDSGIQHLRSELAIIDQQISFLGDEIYALKQLEDLESNLDALRVLSPEEMFKRNAEIDRLQANLDGLKKNKIAALAEAQSSITVIEIKIAALRNSVSKFAPSRPNDNKVELTWLSFETGVAKSQKEKKLMVVDFYTDWCRWCKVMDKETYGHESVIKFAKEKLVLVKVNAESSEKTRFREKDYTYRELAAAFGVNGYPATAFIDAEGKIITFSDGNGQVYNVLPGYRPAEEFLPILEYFGSGYHKKMSFDAFLEKRKKS